MTTICQHGQPAEYLHSTAQLRPALFAGCGSAIGISYHSDHQEIHSPDMLAPMSRAYFSPNAAYFL